MFLALVQGGILLAIALGVMGAVWRRLGLSVLGAGLVFLEGVPLIFSFAWLAVLVSGLFLLAARDTAPIRGASLAGARVLGSVAGLWALADVPSLLRSQPLLMVRTVPAVTIQQAVDDVLRVRVFEIGGDNGGELWTHQTAHGRIPG